MCYFFLLPTYEYLGFIVDMVALHFRQKGIAVV